ncbi:MAG: fasciclin domain-containing protein [Bacillota bacterium]
MKLFKRVLMVPLLLLLFACEDAKSTVEDVENPDPITVTQFDTIEGSLNDSVEVTLEDGSTQSLPVDWSRSLDTVDTSSHGTVQIEGTLDSEANVDVGDKKAIQSIEIEAATLEKALEHSEDTEHFERMYAAFEHSDKEDAKTLFVPDDDAVESLLDLLDMDLETLMEDDLFETLMLDHMSAEAISQNRLETDIPSVYTALNDRELIVEGEQGEPLIDSEHERLESVDLDTHHLHVIDGVILSDDTLAEVGSDVFDDDMRDRLFEVFQDEGLVSDALRGQSFTVFMPSEEALIEYADEKDLSLNELLESSAFEELLIGHIVAEEYSAESLFSEAPSTLEAYNGNPIEITVSDDDLYADQAQIIDSEQVEQFGTVLTIDDVLEDGE